MFFPQRLSPHERLKAFLKRSGYVQVVAGRLDVFKMNSKRFNSEWLAQNSDEILRAILHVTGRKAYVYQSFSRSNQGYGVGKYPGVTLQFKELSSEKSAYLILNAEVLKQNGRLRKRKEFLPPKNGALVEFWRRTVGDLPNGRRSRIWEHMSSLNPYLFNIRTRSDGKGENKSAGLLSISFDEISSSSLDEVQPNCGPDTYAPRTVFTDEGRAWSLQKRGLRANRTTSDLDHETSQQGNKIVRDAPVSKDINNQSMEEWLAEYSREDD